MQKGTNIAGLRVLSLERSASKKLSYRFASGNLAFEMVPTVPTLIRVAHCTSVVCTNTVVYDEPLLSLWESEIL